jgi:pentapeptide MXKDX repeat protein
MMRFLRVLCVVLLGVAVGLTTTGCGPTSATPKSGDKMGSPKMSGDKMTDDKMGSDKMKQDKMGGDKMKDGK